MRPCGPEVLRSPNCDLRVARNAALCQSFSMLSDLEYAYVRARRLAAHASDSPRAVHKRDRTDELTCAALRFNCSA